MRGRMFVRGVLLAALVAPPSGCGAEEAPCFEGPAVTYTEQYVDIMSVDVPLEGVEACLIIGGSACGCRTSDATGYVELALPADAEVVWRFSRDDMVPVFSFIRPPVSGAVHSRRRVATRTLLSAFASFVGVDVDWSLGFAVVEAYPVDGTSLAGSVAELREGSEALVQEGSGPIYLEAEGLIDVDATASVGSSVAAVWLNLPPGRLFAGLEGSQCEPLLPRCDWFYSGWPRELDGELVLEMEVFAGAMTSVIARECTP
jgi:hypothetical protein